MRHGNAQSWRQRLLPGADADLRPWQRGNLIAGVTVAAYLVPQVMAYATVASLPAIVGLWAAVPALLIYAVMGSSRVLSLGPESSVALMTAAVVGPLALGNAETYVGLAATLALVVGVIGLVASLLRVSFISDLLSRPVLVGYMAGIGLLMIEGQLDHFLGIDTDSDSPLGHLGAVVAALPSANLAVLALAVVVLALLLLIPRIDRRLPGPLLAITAAAGLAAALTAFGATIPLIGPVPQGLPDIALPALPQQDLELLLLGAAGVALVGFTDTVLTARAFRHRHEPLDITAELRAMSVGNIGASLVQGMPVSSSGSRTALARASGARSQGYSVVAAVLVIVVLLIAGPVLAVLPQAGLAALVIYAALQLIEVGEFRSLWRFDRVEFALALITCLAVLVVGILYGVLVAVGLSVLAMLARVARPHSAALGFVRGVPGMHDIEDFEDVGELPGLLVFRYDSPLFFANAQDFKVEALRMCAEREPGLQWFALNCEAVIDIDSTAVSVMNALLDDLAEMGVTCCLVRAKRELLIELDRAGILARIGDEHVFPTLPTLVETFRSR